MHYLWYDYVVFSTPFRILLNQVRYQTTISILDPLAWRLTSLPRGGAKLSHLIPISWGFTGAWRVRIITRESTLYLGETASSSVNNSPLCGWNGWGWVNSRDGVKDWKSRVDWRFWMRLSADIGSERDLCVDDIGLD